ncbi:Formin-like protein 21b (AtFH21b), partial [Durusdinium trenchii]
MPTEEEAKQLLGYRGDPAQLRRLEQELLPFSVLSPSAQQRLQLGLLQRELQGRAEELHRGFQVWRRGTTAVLKSRALSETLRHLLSLGNTLNGGKVEGFSLEVLPRLGLSKATGDQRITLLHVLVMQLSSQHSQLPQTLLEELQELRSLASMPLPNLALDLAAFGDDVQLARQLLRQAFPAFDPPPERFFIGDDVEDDTEVEAVADAELSNSIIAKHLLRDVYMRIAQAPPEPLKQMVQTASAELQQLKAELAELREQVATMLAFFAYGEIA